MQELFDNLPAPPTGFALAINMEGVMGTFGWSENKRIYDATRLEKCFDHFLTHSKALVAVRDVPPKIAARAYVVISAPTPLDDVITFMLAAKWQCCWVDNDRYRDHTTNAAIPGIARDYLLCHRGARGLKWPPQLVSQEDAEKDAEMQELARRRKFNRENPEVPEMKAKVAKQTRKWKTSMWNRLKELTYEGHAAPGDHPSAGSALHASGKCTPCRFFLEGACALEADCPACHYSHAASSAGDDASRASGDVPRDDLSDTVDEQPKAKKPKTGAPRGHTEGLERAAESVKESLLYEPEKTAAKIECCDRVRDGSSPA